MSDVYVVEVVSDPMEMGAERPDKWEVSLASRNIITRRRDITQEGISEYLMSHADASELYMKLVVSYPADQKQNWMSVRLVRYTDPRWGKAVPHSVLMSQSAHTRRRG